mmetsp:Transcript_36242/g.90467  ORF Transcript_36242/g.90467 Transcript_36242/m.90467 type:complete len:90 (+) Transcript_36242:650-919(+)
MEASSGSARDGRRPPPPPPPREAPPPPRGPPRGGPREEEDALRGWSADPGARGGLGRPAESLIVRRSAVAAGRRGDTGARALPSPRLCQ